MSYLDGIPEFPPMVKAWQAQRQLPAIPGAGGRGTIADAVNETLQPVQVQAARRPMPPGAGQPQGQPQSAGRAPSTGGGAGTAPTMPYVGPITPEMQAAAVRLGAYDDDLTALQEQLEEAQMLRDFAMPEGRQAGRTFVAANPLEFLATGLKQHTGRTDQRDIRGQRAGVIENRRSDREKIIEALMKQQQGPTGPTPPPRMNRGEYV